jgi:hypothetical protein
VDQRKHWWPINTRKMIADDADLRRNVDKVDPGWWKW